MHSSFILYSNSLNGINGTLGRFAKEQFFHESGYNGNSTLQRRFAGGHEKDVTRLNESNRKISPNSNLKIYRPKQEAEASNDDSYYGNQFVRYVLYSQLDHFAP